MPSGGEINYVHAQTIFTDQIEEELRASVQWHTNWGFLANRPQPPPRGFSTKTTKYSYGPNQWSIKQKRVPDESAQGIAAAEAERNQRKEMSHLAYNTAVTQSTKPCEALGAYKGMKLVESDTSGVKNREAALLMRTHKFQTLGIACHTVGVNPVDKYRQPVSASHEVGWRATRSAGNGRPGLEIFGVGDHAMKQICKPGVDWGLMKKR